MVKPFKSKGASNEGKAKKEILPQSAKVTLEEGATASGGSTVVDGACGAAGISEAARDFESYQFSYEVSHGNPFLELKNQREEELNRIRSRSAEDEYQGTTSLLELHVQAPEDVLCCQDKDGDNELMLAIMKRHVPYALFIIEILISRKKQKLLNIRNSLGQAAMHLAVMTDLPLVTKALVSAGVMLDIRDNNGRTPLHCASCRGLLKQVEVITTSNSDPKFVKKLAELLDYEGWSSIHLATKNGYIHIIEHLVQYAGANINQPGGGRGMTALHLAILAQDISMMLFLLQIVKADVSILTYDKWSALELAVGFGHLHLVEPLIKAGASSDEYLYFDQKLALIDQASEVINMD